MAKLLLMVAAAVAVSSWAGGGELRVAGQSIVFRNEPPMPELISSQPPSCLSSSTVGGDLCVEDPEYDNRIKQRVLRLLESDPGVSALLSDPSLRTILNDVEPKTDSISVDTRFGGDTETPVCSAQETLIYPKRAKTPGDQWVFVLNQEGVQQALRVEKCTSDGSSCGLGMVLPGDAKATCRQKYVYRRMLVLGTNKIEPEEVLMPSCCVCYTTYQGLVTRSRNSTRVHVPDSTVPASQPMGSPAASHMPASSGPVASSVAGHSHFFPMPLRFSRSERRSGRIAYPFVHR